MPRVEDQIQRAVLLKREPLMHRCMFRRRPQYLFICKVKTVMSISESLGLKALDFTLFENFSSE